MLFTEKQVVSPCRKRHLCSVSNNQKHDLRNHTHFVKYPRSPFPHPVEKTGRERIIGQNRALSGLDWYRRLLLGCMGTCTSHPTPRLAHQCADMVVHPARG